MSTSQPSDSDSSQKAPTQESDKKSLSQVIGGWLRKHYLSLINSLLAIYVFMPFLAPIFMKTGQPKMAEPIYKFYGIFKLVNWFRHLRLTCFHKNRSQFTNFTEFFVINWLFDRFSCLVNSLSIRVNWLDWKSGLATKK